MFTRGHPLAFLITPCIMYTISLILVIGTDLVKPLFSAK